MNEGCHRGYPAVVIYSDGSKRKRAVHRMVCEAFHGPEPRCLPLVRHLDGNRFNHHPSNLKWGNTKQNAEDYAANGHLWESIGETKFRHDLELIEERRARKDRNRQARTEQL